MLYGLADVAVSTFGRIPARNTLRKDEFWAIRNMSFELKPGECLGIIGPNGAGKTTLLKLLNGIILPDAGRITVAGRMGALIEVGAGFHPLLTGRENIYVNGAILGMGKREIAAKLNQIIAFSGLEEFIDTPVKFYSSGMYVRLGFSIAAYVEPELLLIDEALAVGDMEFQRSCQIRLAELTARGVAVVFVSHSMDLVQHFCHRVILMDRELPPKVGSFQDVFPDYLKRTLTLASPHMNRVIEAAGESGKVARQTGEIEILEIELRRASDGLATDTFMSGEGVVVDVLIASDVDAEEPVFQLAIYREDGIMCCLERTSDMNVSPPTLQKGRGHFGVTIDRLLLGSGIYWAEILVADSMAIIPFGRRRRGPFRVVDGTSCSSQANYQPIYKQNLVWHFGTGPQL